ncbi:hypothetical protein FSST1_012225 [Fusarium sambucinum]
MATSVFFGRQRRFVSRRLAYAVLILIIFVYAIITVLSPTVVPVAAPEDATKALLPPLQDRPFVYCYYDATIKKAREEKDAESRLLLTWRRA